MRVRIISEHGYSEALFGLGLSHGVTSGKNVLGAAAEKRMRAVALHLAGKDGGHNKFLRQISVWLDITAPLYWWKEFDTYKVGTTAQSESTMHTLLKKPLEEGHFEGPLPDAVLGELREAWNAQDFHRLNTMLPHSFRQRRIVSCNYAVLRNILMQRRNHKLPEWHTFRENILSQAIYYEFLMPVGEEHETAL